MQLKLSSKNPSAKKLLQMGVDGRVKRQISNRGSLVLGQEKEEQIE